MATIKRTVDFAGTDVLSVTAQLMALREPFALSIVVEARGSTSARVGAKAVFNHEGDVICGWVGGGCVESTMAHAAIESLETETSQIVDVDLDDEVLGAGMPCGGSMRVYVEPVIPHPTLWILGHGRVAECLCHLGALMSFDVMVNDPMASPDRYPGATRVITDDPDYGALTPKPTDFVVIATQHRGDYESLRRLLASDVAYIALIASRKRTTLVIDYLRARGFDQPALARIRAPAGIDIGARTAEEMALSVYWKGCPGSPESDYATRLRKRHGPLFACLDERDKTPCPALRSSWAASRRRVNHADALYDESGPIPCSSGIRPATSLAASRNSATNSLSTSPPRAGPLQATNTSEVAMPEDGNGSGLVSLFWGLWIYWFFSSWCEHLSSLSKTKASQSRQTISPTAASALNISAGCAELEAIVSQILTRCGGIAVNDFLSERLAAFETVVAAFDAGDRRTLRKQVSAEVYAVFSDAIAVKEGRQEKTETIFALIAPPTIVAALIDDGNAEISLRFIADSYRVSQGAFGRRMPQERHSVDIWTFGCTAPSNKWRLIATEAEQ